MQYRQVGILFFGILVTTVMAKPVSDEALLEESVCGLKEPFIFWLWSNTAGNPDEDRLQGLKNIENITFTSKDGKRILGYKLSANPEKFEKAKGFLLVMQGNAILVDQILDEFVSFSEAGLDVYAYDFRGYGRSDGKRRLKAMVSDYTEILHALTSIHYDERFIYAMSFGGILFLNSFEPKMKLNRVIIDSSPSRLSDYGCPEDYDPVNHLPENSRQFVFITGLRDNVVTPTMSAELRNKAHDRGALLITDDEFSHPFMDHSFSIHQRRMKTIRDIILSPDGIN